MPTSAGTDLIPARKRTKRALAAVKGADSYDALISELLRAVPPERLRERLDFRKREAVNLATGRRADAIRIATGRLRSPEKQLMIARAAARTRARWEDHGVTTRRGSRRVQWDAGKIEATVRREGVRVRRKPGTGPAIAGEGA